ncbi:MAG: ArdC family protein [Candidatus Acidiferrales bacterium]
MKVEQAKQIANKAIEELTAALNANPSEALTGYLKTVAKFHKYSFNNILLIAMACPQATHVAGFHTWRMLGRHVKRGAKGIRIVAPVSRRRAQQADTHINEEILSGSSTSVFGFRAVYVFDESMTEGKPLAELNSVQGDPSDYQERLEQFIQELGIALEYSPDIAPARGTSQGGKITILPGQSPAEIVETLAHEIAHELMHRGDRRTTTTKRQRETEAEAVAFIVANAIGLQATSASADYITLWNGDAMLLAQSLEIIQRTAVQIITATSKRAAPAD